MKIIIEIEIQGKLKESDKEPISNVIQGALESVTDQIITVKSISVNFPRQKTQSKYPPEYHALRQRVFELLQDRRGYSSRQPPAEAKAISQMLEENFTPEQIIQAYDLMKKQNFYRDKYLSMMTVRKDIHEVLKNGTHQGSNSQYQKEYISPTELKRRARQEDMEQCQQPAASSVR
jgi:hypothetical protein